MSSRTKKQSHENIPTANRQAELLKEWQESKKPAYLVLDKNKNILRLYTDWHRANNWVDGTSRTVRYNDPAHKYEAGLIQRKQGHI